MKRRLLLSSSVFFVICSGATLLFAQTTGELRPRFGITVQPAVNIHAADFTALPDVPNCCPQFTGGSGFGFGIGLLAEFPVAKRWWLGGRGIFASQSATMIATESTDVLIDGIPQNGAFEHSLAAGLSAVAFEPLVMFNPFSRFRLLAGGRLGAFLSGTFDQKETIAQPGVGVFPDTRTRSRNERSGNIPQLQSFQAGLIFGIAHELPLNRARTLYLQPDITFMLALTPVAGGVALWNAHALRFGISLKYAPAIAPPDTSAKVSPQVPAIANNTTLKTESPNMSAADNQQRAVSNDKPQTPSLQLTVRNLSENAQSPLPTAQSASPPARIHIEEFVSRQMRPLLNYIFFEDNSAEIPDRYSQISANETTRFRVESLRGKDVLPTYYELLNIIGRRMTERPSATLAVTGCNADEGAEQGNTTLSSRRAEAVRRYLTEVWGIPSARISVKRRGKPEKPTAGLAEAAPDAAAENRRVEIASNDPAILAPFVSADTTRMAVTGTLNVEMKNYDATIKAGSGGSIAKPHPISTFEILAGGKMLRRIDADSARVNWSVELEPTDVLNAIAAVREVKFRAQTPGGQTAEATATVELTTLSRKRSAGTADREIDRYRLILFDFDNAGLTPANRAAIALIRENIRAGATVGVRGYTDRMGEESYNRTLSSDRARAAARALGLPENAAAGDGETLLYDNDLPEGRFYNRTVHVTVQTPVR